MRSRNYFPPYTSLSIYLPLTRRSALPMYGIDFEKEELDWYTQLNSIFCVSDPLPEPSIKGGSVQISSSIGFLMLSLTFVSIWQQSSYLFVHLTNNNSFSKVKKDIPRCASEEAANTEDNFCAVKITKKQSHSQYSDIFEKRQCLKNKCIILRVRTKKNSFAVFFFLPLVQTYQKNHFLISIPHSVD